MGDESLVSESALAAYDAASARLFGREAPEGLVESLPWRTGEPGVESVEEFDVAAGVMFGRITGAERLAAERRMAETARQLAKEREVLERARRLGWETALAATPAADRAVAESVRARAGVSVAPASGRLSEARATGAGTGRAELREVTGWDPARRAGGR